MKFTDLFIKRPVLASVVSLLIFFFGLRAMFDMQVRQFPKIDDTLITVTTSYPGASAELMEGFVTTPLQRSIAGAEGIDYLTAESTTGLSTISAYIKLNFNPQEAFTNISSKAAEVRGDLPRETEEPVVQKQRGDGSALMYLSFDSTQMSPEQITDYVNRVVVPKIATLPGVGAADVLGGSTFSMRIWLDPTKMAARQVTPEQVTQALIANNFQTAAGATKGKYVAINIRATTDIHNPHEFDQLVILSNDSGPVRIRDVARVELGAENYDSKVTFNGKKAVFVGISGTPTANPLTVIHAVREELPAIGNNLPPSLQYSIAYDATKYIETSIDEVIRTIFEATVIVVIVIFLFLGSLRSVIIPVVTIPLSLVGVCSLMLWLGYSINLLTLLAMVLAIGLVVDDAIVVVENIHRHMEEGLSPMEAALVGAREIALPIISMTITLAAVYAPIAFMTGITGALFKEFALTLAATVIISGIVALTLSPMMCSLLLTKADQNSKLVHKLDVFFEKIKVRYQHLLHGALSTRSIILVLAATVLTSLFYLYPHTAKEAAPPEDVGFMFVIGTAPEYATQEYVHAFSKEYLDILAKADDIQDYFMLEGRGAVNSVFGGLIFKPWNERHTKIDQYKQAIMAKLDTNAGFQTYVDIPAPLPGGGSGLPINFVITSTNDYRLIQPLADQLAMEANKSGLFIFASNTLKFDRPELVLEIDRDKAAQLGVSMQDVGSALSRSLSEGYINRFALEGHSYKVIPQVEQIDRLVPSQLLNIYVRAQSGTMIPLSTLATVSTHTIPNKLTQFQQQNAATVQGIPRPGVTLGQALDFLEHKAQEILPKGTSYGFAGQSRQYETETNSLLYAFFFSILIIFLVLSAQFESFRDPLIILVSVPMSICGALIFLNLGFATVNIYTQVGLITLIGLISKHGILMVDFANHLQINKGYTIQQAIEEAAAVRLRPILMTTAAMIFGVLPLVFASGAGAMSRYNIGLVIATGMSIGTLFTLFVVPTIYTYLANDHHSKAEI